VNIDPKNGARPEA